MKSYGNSLRLRMLEEAARRGGTLESVSNFAGQHDHFLLKVGDLEVRHWDFGTCVDILLDKVFGEWTGEEREA